MPLQGHLHGSWTPLLSMKVIVKMAVKNFLGCLLPSFPWSVLPRAHTTACGPYYISWYDPWRGHKPWMHHLVSWDTFMSWFTNHEGVWKFLVHFQVLFKWGRFGTFLNFKLLWDINWLYYPPKLASIYFVTFHASLILSL